MNKVKLIDIEKSILSDNKDLANALRYKLTETHTFMVNVMASPGAGKTSLILRTIEKLGADMNIGVLEGDIEATLDSDRIASMGIEVVQIRTGGLCHLDAAMIEKGLESLHVESIDLVFIENVGNLVCPAEYDTGAFKNVAILSVPEGDDKPVKYPLIFRVADTVIINKIDYCDYEAFDMESVTSRIKLLNHGSRVFPLSCRTSQGVDEWIGWLRKEIGALTAD
jgi:hydrogenase nickel incorporation protein HypB